MQVRRGGDGRRRCRRVDGGAAAADAGLGLIVTCRPDFGRERGSCCRDPNAEIPARASRNQLYDVRALQKHASNAEYVANVEGGRDYYYAAIWFMVLLMLALIQFGWIRPSSVDAATMQFQLLLRRIYGN